MCEKFLGCFLNSLTGVSWRMLCNSQVSLMTWKQLRRRWVLKAISLWTFFSSLITFLLSRWAERFCCTVTERNIPLPCIWRKSRSADTHWYQWIPQYLSVQSRNSVAFLKNKMWSQPCSRIDEDSSPVFMFLPWNPVSLLRVMKYS